MYRVYSWIGESRSRVIELGLVDQAYAAKGGMVQVVVAYVQDNSTTSNKLTTSNKSTMRNRSTTRNRGFKPPDQEFS